MIFRDLYFFLSNFFDTQITIEIEGKKLTFKNAEAGYQAHKNTNVSDKFCFLSGIEAKKLGAQVKITDPNWGINRLYAMAKVLNAKFKNTYLLFMLQHIKEDIVEDNYWKDTFWGVYKGEGKNILGKMLMNIRDHNNDYGALLAYIKTDLINYV